jgi:UDP-N-acetylmuramate--alanine ligase
VTESRTITLPTGIAAPPPDLSRPHFIGIGGVGTSGLARVLVTRGARVTGSDASAARLEKLAAAGCTVRPGHDAPPPADASCVVVSTAIGDDNPEVIAARAAGIRVVHRAQVLAALMDGHTGVAIAGTHGKSSTTAMLATIFTRLGANPSYAIGATLAETGANARHGDGPLFIAEADESDLSFLWLRQALAVILNVEHDHPENYAGLDAHLDAYARFADGIVPGGTLVISADGTGAAELTGRLRASRRDLKIVTYGAAPGADWHITEITASGMSSQVTVTTPGGQQVTASLPVPGRHMAHNAVAALAAAVQAGATADAAALALSSYRGIRGRLTQHGDTPGGVLVLDSFAHHPTAISADLEAARTLAEDSGQVIAVFQPCGYTRTIAQAPEMAVALKAADMAVLLEIHASVGEPVPGVSARLIADAGTGQLASPSDAVKRVTAAASPGDVVLVMGTGGDLDLLAERICAALAASQSALR